MRLTFERTPKRLVELAKTMPKVTCHLISNSLFDYVYVIGKSVTYFSKFYSYKEALDIYEKIKKECE